LSHRKPELREVYNFENHGCADFIKMKPDLYPDDRKN
jgi:hypothetical protein